jgi:hypothetical protein
MAQIKNLDVAKNASKQTSGPGTWGIESGANTPNQDLTEVLAHVGTGLKLFKEIYGASRVETQNNFYLAGDDELTDKMGNIMAPGAVSQRSKFFRKQLIGESNSPKTYKYLMHRAGKNIGKLALDTTASVTKVGGGGYVKAVHEGSSATSSGIHARSLAKIRESASELTGSADLNLILTVLERLKISKAIIRGTTAVLDCIPIPGPAELGGVVLSVGKTARKLAYAEIVQNMCQLIHFLALREQYIYDGSVTAIFGHTSDLNKGGKPFNPHGYDFCAKKPATEIFRSIIWRDMWYAGFGSQYFAKITSVQYDFKAIIKEPAGWMVMFDKAMSD